MKEQRAKMKVRASEQEPSLLELLQRAQPNFNEVKDDRAKSKDDGVSSKKKVNVNNFSFLLE